MKTIRKAVIIETKKYDHKYTDMACAWSTIYELFFPFENVRESVDVGTGWRQKFEEVAPNIEIIPLTDEIKTQYYSYCEKEFEKYVEYSYQRYMKEIEDYNSSKSIQSKGQIVKVTKGKYKNYIGKVTWCGKDKFKSVKRSSNVPILIQIVSARPYILPSQHELFALRPIEGEFFPNGKSIIYISSDKGEVIEGFVPVSLSKETVASFERRMKANLDSYEGYYDVRKFI